MPAEGFLLCGLQTGEFRFAAGPPGVVTGKAVDQQPQGGFGIGNDMHVGRPGGHGLQRVDIDADETDLFVAAPFDDRMEEAGPDGERDVDPGQMSLPTCMVWASGWRMSRAPSPCSLMITGACSISQSSRSSASAPNTPLPAKIAGFAAPPRRIAARSIASGSGASGGGAAGMAAEWGREARAAAMSGGISMTTGRLRPPFSCRKASSTTGGMAAAASIRACHFDTEASAPSWSGISCRKPRPPPIWPDGIWPVTQSTGALQA